MPKSRIGGYIFFVKRKYDEKRAQLSPDKKCTNIIRFAKDWNELSEKKKGGWNKIAAESEQKRYDREMKELLT